MRYVLIVIALFALSACKESILLPDGSTHACDVTDNPTEGYSIAVCDGRGVYKWTPESGRWAHM